MKYLSQRVAALLLAAVMSLTLTGCMFRSSVEDLFTLPRVSAEYEGLSQELDDLAIAIMDVHAQQYGKPAWPVFTPISDEAAEQVAERERKIAERQRKRQDDGHGHGEEDSDEPPRQTFDHLPAIREAP